MTNQPEYFLWPKPGNNWPVSFATTNEIESELSVHFPSGYPVVVSSGRAGLALTLKTMGLGRGDFVQIFPYASHCVLDAVSRVATPIGGNVTIGSNDNVHIHYHQWGYVQRRNVVEDDIEDAVDTLCVPGAALFPFSGRFEIWSLPKILGTSCGGVVWCKTEDDAAHLIALRDLSNVGAYRQWALRRLGQLLPAAHGYWAGMEAIGGRLPSIALGEIKAAIGKWQTIVDDRKLKLNILKAHLPQWLSLDEHRLPCAVPILAAGVEETTAAKIAALGVTTGTRHFERIDQQGVSTLESVLPLPIHQDVPIDLVGKMASILPR